MWNGLFSPTCRKHRIYTGDISNHIEIASWDVDGNFVTVEARWIGGETLYTYEFEISWGEAREMDASRAKELVLQYHHLI